MEQAAQARGETLKRRGLMVGLAGLLGGLLTRVTARPAAAADGQALILGSWNQSSAMTTIATPGTAIGSSVLSVTSGGPGGALAGSTESGTGVTGVSMRMGVGVMGLAGGVGGTGVEGNGNGSGVIGNSLMGIGVQAIGRTAGVRATANDTGVWAAASSEDSTGVVANGGSVGAYGASSNIGTMGSGGNYGVLGVSGGGQGVNGQSATSIGVVGTSGGSQPGVYGSSAHGAGIYGTTGDTSTGLAAYFVGPVVVSGDFTVKGGAKSAAVDLPDGSTRRLYCLESPESYFEDFGTGRLQTGSASVRLPDDFAAVIESDQYYVFLTPEGDSNGLYVSNKTRAGFEVREQHAGTSNTRFQYRVLGRRHDIQGARLQKVHLPAVPGAVAQAKVPHVAVADPVP